MCHSRSLRGRKNGATSTLTYLHADHLGSASLGTNASGSKVSDMRYYPYGETRSGTLATDRRYTGQRQESGLGLYDYTARSYDPALGRFIQADTLVPSPANPQSLNRYAYVLNSPLKYTDPTGHREILDEQDGKIILGGPGWFRPAKESKNPYPHAPEPSFRFTKLPIEPSKITGVNGFGAYQWAVDVCGGSDGTGECPSLGSACPYRRTRGLHNGMDFIARDGTSVYWTGTVSGIVVDVWGSDASPNVVVKVGPYYALYGHLSERSVNIGDTIAPNTEIGKTGEGHLHLGVRTDTQYLNPLYLFDQQTTQFLVTQMSEYFPGETAWSILAYDYSFGACDRYFWGTTADKTGVDR